PLDADLETACARRVGCGFIQGYGLTEASPVTHANSDEPGKCKPGTVGQLLPNTECRIVDVTTGADRGPDEDGELLIRGPQVLLGGGSAADLMGVVAERVAPYKKSRAGEVIDAIPKSPSGKILRRVLKERGQPSVI